MMRHGKGQGGARMSDVCNEYRSCCDRSIDGYYDHTSLNIFMQACTHIRMATRKAYYFSPTRSDLPHLNHHNLAQRPTNPLHSNSNSITSARSYHQHEHIFTGAQYHSISCTCGVELASPVLTALAERIGKADIIAHTA